VGKTITEKYSKKPIPADCAKYMFVGLPTISIMLQVFAATNSPTKKGSGEMPAFLQKMQIGGVKVKMIISLEVNTVKTETIR
jgi:hypothetical protein